MGWINKKRLGGIAVLAAGFIANEVFGWGLGRMMDYVADSVPLADAANWPWGAWQVSFQKIPLAISTTVVFFLICLFTMFIFFKHDIFEWTHDYLYDPKDPRFDALLALKHGDFLSMNWFCSLFCHNCFSLLILRNRIPYQV